MLIAISGSQGAGKSVVLNRLKKLGHDVVERKTSRSILSDWGVTLKEVNDNRELTLKFQDEILTRKYKDDLNALTGKLITFTERTFSDLFVYSLISLGKDNQNSDWLNNYYEKCNAFNVELYSHVFYIEGGKFQVIHDGVRGSNQHYSKMVDLTMKDYTIRMNPLIDVTIIKTPNLQERVELIFNNVYNNE